MSEKTWLTERYIKLLTRAGLTFTIAGPDSVLMDADKLGTLWNQAQQLEAIDNDIMRRSFEAEGRQLGPLPTSPITNS